MDISVDRREGFAVLQLRGEFDTYYCRLLQQEVDKLCAAGETRAILDLRLVRFINSTALGAIIKASKQLTKAGGRLVLARPSKFCREIIAKVGLDRVVPVYDTEEAAVEAIGSGKAATRTGGAATSLEDDESSVMFSPVDPERVEHFLPAGQLPKEERASPIDGFVLKRKNWYGIGRMAGVDERGVRFTWNGGTTGMAPFAMSQFLAIGTPLKIKFRIPMFKKDFCEAVATVTEIEERDEGVKLGVAFSEIDDKTLAAIRQYTSDLKFLKDELRTATGR
jgi:anti-anti-sigma factor